MNRSAKVAAGVSVAVVGGLLALAAPAFASIGDVVRGTVQSVGIIAKTLEPSPAFSPDESELEALAEADPLEGYVYIGEGTWIPVGGPGGCTTTAFINTRSVGDGPWRATLLGGELLDMGESVGARGEVIMDADGIRAYVVAPGDNMISIGERLCVSWPTVTGFNNIYGAIQPGQELNLRPDPSVPWEPIYPSKEQDEP